MIHGKAEEVDIPEKVDVLVSEWMGFYLLHESMLNSVIAARDRHLSDDGIVLPSHAKIVSAACTMDAFNRDNVDYWNSVYGFDMSPLKRIALAREKPEVGLLPQPVPQYKVSQYKLVFQCSILKGLSEMCTNRS